MTASVPPIAHAEQDRIEAVQPDAVQVGGLPPQRRHLGGARATRGTNRPTAAAIPARTTTIHPRTTTIRRGVTAPCHRVGADGCSGGHGDPPLHPRADGAPRQGRRSRGLGTGRPLRRRGDALPARCDRYALPRGLGQRIRSRGGLSLRKRRASVRAGASVGAGAGVRARARRGCCCCGTPCTGTGCRAPSVVGHLGVHARRPRLLAQLAPQVARRSPRPRGARRPGRCRPAVPSRFTTRPSTSTVCTSPRWAWNATWP